MSTEREIPVNSEGSQASSLAVAVEQALQSLSAGNPGAAETLCDQILEAEPSHARALNLAGIIACHKRRPDLGIALFKRAITANSNVAEFHSNMGNAYAEVGRLCEALVSYIEALRVEPLYAQVFENLGLLLEQLKLPSAGAFARGVAQGLSFGARLPDTTPAKHGAALARFFLDVGIALQSQKELHAACACMEAAWRWSPDSAQILVRLAGLLIEVGRDEEGLVIAARGVERAPQSAEARAQLGLALGAAGRHAEAASSLRQALELDATSPHSLQFWRGLACALAFDGQLDEAVRAYDVVVAEEPDDVQSRVHRGTFLLKKGDFQAGWREYEWRHRLPQLRAEPWLSGVPLWRGEDIDGKTIAVFTEQGFGDTLQFMRYLPLLARRGARVIVLCEPELRRIVATVAGVYSVPDTRDRVPAAGYQCRLLSLPYLFETLLSTIPRAPYVSADADAVEKWRVRLGPRKGLRVGLAWKGRRGRSLEDNRVDRRRSFDLSTYSSLLTLQEVQYHSLQWGISARETQDFGVIEYPPDAVDFFDVVPLVENLDLVISVDTALAHLTGALGKPVWLLSRYDGCWRWLTGREDSPWYPSMRIFRQPEPGDWQSVIARVRAALNTWG